MKNRKNRTKVIIILLVVILGLGYAYINSDLNINGLAEIKSASWDVHFANVQVENGSVSGTNVVTAPTISNKTTLNYSIVLPQPGDYYGFTVDVVNAGTMDAMIDMIDSKLNGSTITTLPDYLSYDIYIDLYEIKANTTETVTVWIGYRTDIEANQLPTTDQTLNFQLTMQYKQADKNALGLAYKNKKLDFERDLATLKAELEQRCLNDTSEAQQTISIDSDITMTVDFLRTSTSSADISIIYPNAEDNLYLQTSFSIDCDVETGDERIAVGECPIYPERPFNNFKINGSDVTHPSTLSTFVQREICPKLRGMVGNIDKSCLQKIIDAAQ